MTQFRELAERYQLEKILKSTRSGTVLRAVDSPSGRTVAIKLITMGAAPGLEAVPPFEKLAAALTALRHPSLPAVLDAGFTTEGQAFLAMELLDGRGLDTVTGNAGATPARAIALLGQALNGLEVLASKGFAHHNVSPDNLFATGAGAAEQVKLLGLGSALFRPPGATAQGNENARFQAPELAAGAAADWRADIYSLALTACHVLGATVGFGDAPVVQMPLALSFELDNDEALRQALEKSLRQNPAERPTHREVRDAFRLALGGAAAPQPVAAPQPSPVLPMPVPVPVAPAAPIMAAALPVPVPVPAPTPAVVAEEPADGDMLSAVDDEVLNALLSVPAPPPRPGGQPPARGAGKVVPFLQKKQKQEKAPPAVTATAASGEVPPARGDSRSLLPVLLGVGAAILVIGAFAAYWFLGGQPEVETAAQPVPVAPARPPQRPAAERLAEAGLYLAQGEDNQARLVLRALTFEDQGALGAAGCRTLASIEQTLALSTLERLPRDLADGLKEGDLGMLQNAVSTAAEQGVLNDLSPEVRILFDRARSLVELYGAAQAANVAGKPAEVLERFAALEGVLPDFNDPEDLRNKAAGAIEAEAAKLVAEGKYDQGLARLDPIVRHWSGRSGLKDKVSSYRKFKEDEARQETLLAGLPNIERRRKPHEGLEAIKGVQPTPHLAPRFAEVRKRLEDQLDQLDKTPPQVELRSGYVLTYFRGTPIELSFRVTDDYLADKVKVKLMARPEGGKMQNLPLEASRTGNYTVLIPSSFHANGTVELYVVATDLSGNEGFFGTPAKPEQITRR